MMENPILEFRKSLGCTRTEFSTRTGIGYQVLRAAEMGATKRLSANTIECLSYVGIGEDIQQKLDDWHILKNEERKNLMLKDKEKSDQNNLYVNPENLMSKQQKTSSKKSTEVDTNE